jgi:hypothetical protein
MEPTAAVPDDLKTFARQKLRHEYGHLISARILGFQTGEVGLKLFPENREHEAWSEIFINTPLLTTDDIAEFLERRIVVLFCGAMAEAPCADDVGGDYVEQICFKSDGGSRDEGKIHEFIALHQNIRRPDQIDPVAISAGRRSLYMTLRGRGADLIFEEFELIDGLAADHVEHLMPVTRGWSWALRKQDVDALPANSRSICITV